MTLFGSYNYFYKTIYGPCLIFYPPAGLVHYLQSHNITSSTQLEALFVLFNAALQRNPLCDAVPASAQCSKKRLRVVRREQEVVQAAFRRIGPCRSLHSKGNALS